MKRWLLPREGVISQILTILLIIVNNFNIFVCYISENISFLNNR